jgi:hypothetical protein
MEQRNRLGQLHVQPVWTKRDCGHPARSIDDATYACPYCVDYAEAIARSLDADLFGDEKFESAPWPVSP